LILEIIRNSKDIGEMQGKFSLHDDTIAVIKKNFTHSKKFNLFHGIKEGLKNPNPMDKKLRKKTSGRQLEIFMLRHIGVKGVFGDYVEAWLMKKDKKPNLVKDSHARSGY